jgi:hypothetical protein
MKSSLLKKAHLFRCARITHSNVPPEYACVREFIARLASGTFLIRLQERLFRHTLGEAVFVGCLGLTLAGCATAGEVASTENPATSFATCSYVRTQQPSCEELKRSYDEGFRAGKEIIAAEFRTRSELNQPYVWQPPMISEVDMPARVVNGMMIPAHRELVIVRPGYWVRTENILQGK